MSGGDFIVGDTISKDQGSINKDQSGDGPKFIPKIYWTGHDSYKDCKIKRSNLDGSNVEDLVTTKKTKLADPTGLTLDLKNKKIYWTNWPINTIYRSDLDGSNIKVVLVQKGCLEDIVLDTTSGCKMYWAEESSGRIQRADCDGTNVKALVTGTHGREGIALDLKNKKIYWVAEAGDKVQRANMDGTGVEDLVTGTNGPNGIALLLP